MMEVIHVRTGHGQSGTDVDVPPVLGRICYTVPSFDGCAVMQQAQ